MDLTKHPLKLKHGKAAPAGSSITWKEGKALLDTGTETYRVSAIGAAKALGIELPDLETMTRWSFDSICESVLGETVEPDGIDEHGSPSWLLAMGYI